MIWSGVLNQVNLVAPSLTCLSFSLDKRTRSLRLPDEVRFSLFAELFHLCCADDVLLVAGTVLREIAALPC